jgi:sugar phosphate isomerase/epimerase
MSVEPSSIFLSRRAFLRNAALSATGLLLLPSLQALGQNGGKSLYSMFRMGLQSYSLRNFPVDDALAKTQTLGLRWWEGYPEHFPITDDPKVIAEYQQKLKAHNIRMPTYGVVDFTNDEADARRKFNFAKSMGLRTFSASPQPDSLPLLDKLVQEYNVRIAIHNHGPGDNLYDTYEKVLAAIQGHDPRIGACLDTGHLLRSSETPETAVDKYGKRLYGLHLKNVKDGENGQKEFTEIGAPGGLLDTIGLFKALYRVQYQGLVSLEYEEHADNPMPYIQQCFDTLRRLLIPDAVLGING